MPTATHWVVFKRSRSTSTPRKTVTIGLMKYPSAASTTWPVRVAKTYVCQLTKMSTPASPMVSTTRRSRTSAANGRQARVTVMSSAQKTSDRSTRQPTISNGPAGASAMK